MITALLFSALAFASPLTDATLEKLFAVTKVEMLSDGLSAQYSSIRERISSGVKAKTKASAEKMAAFDKDLDEAVNDFKKKNLSFASFKPDFVKIYKEAWSEEEIKELIKFYETPTGQKAITTFPATIQKAVATVQQKLQAKSPEFSKQVDAIVHKHFPALK